ncbi:class I SAM-dependent methyltransferase [Kordiimonas sp.]|uniref:class I SAM-dependent methyltransferase n=1 Tax=Kordiimonas sp. TaxID=1970157 RepID=UPI003A9334A7
MTPLKDLIIKRIDATGPISIADYMAECLMHPVHGYYQQERVFGVDGDFITAPEVSQMFGEVLGLWCVDRWIAMGKPPSFQLIELGPGRGTLMADILRAASSVEGFRSAAQVHFVEASLQLRAVQKAKIADAGWHDTLGQIPLAPSIIVANEFFDALPIHQFEKQNGEWFERAIASDGEKLSPALIPASPIAAMLPDTMQTQPDGSVAEICPAALSVMGEIAHRTSTQPCAALVLDYGYIKSAPGDTFQALKAHKYVDPLAEPGKADLTAHVAFDQLAQAATEKGAAAFGPVEQGAFLMSIGIGARAQQLATNQDAAKQSGILSELKRLTAPEEMGQLFKVLALQSPELKAPPGF